MMSSLYVLKTLYSFECRVFFSCQAYEKMVQWTIFEWSLLTDNGENDTVTMCRRG